MSQHRCPECQNLWKEMDGDNPGDCPKCGFKYEDEEEEMLEELLGVSDLLEAYLGDNVYCIYDDIKNNFILTTKHGLLSDPSNIIFLDADTLKSFEGFVKKCKGEK